MKQIEGMLDHLTGRVAIVAARFNEEVVSGLLQGACEVFAQHHFAEDQLTLVRVPGAFELPFMAQRLAKTGDYDAVLALGAVIKGETAHFEYICESATAGLSQVALTHDIPVIYGMLTTYTAEQALVRADVSAKNKGAEVGLALLDMLSLSQQVR